ncbi:hypothetical protein PFICI_03859 [Pestalotiopsis fici W106-1]|uniref:beta-glucosidase n=1 Tax=Pestalotiopsis fici (strain W106-1 / CGMCC3.15140) TaxID=1229662 RepID=W3XIK6_PESFW|nr:uncharacterized protein PFICI_03859 [Pestalotiopsis fici W106-1]ETS85834.1 hypothetical protein PFICI_03859 [Pestalotiopsis fici W106-1]
MAATERVPERVTMPFDQAKVDSQLAALTLEEKVSLLGGSGFATLTGVPRLGIESMKVAEGVNGVKDAMMIDSGDTVGDVLAGKGPKTVCFPSTSCFGATWNTDLMWELGKALAQQARQKGVATIMGPGVNLHRDPRGGRNFEYFAEDPLLTGRLAASLVNGIQAHGVGACLKHFVANEGEDFRRSYNVVDPTGGRALRELYLAAFQETLRYSDPVAVMTSYNKLDGVHCSESPIIAKILRGEWNYGGAVQSDWFGTASTVDSVLAGQDLEMPGPPVWRGRRLLNAVEEGKLDETEIDKRARKMLEWIEKTTGNDFYKQPQPEDDTKAILTSRRVAEEGIVLLKNDDRALPLDFTRPLKITVSGLPAVDPPVGGGGSSLAPPSSVKTPLDGIRDVHAYPDLVDFTGGCKMNKIIPLLPSEIVRNPQDGSSTVHVVYYNNKFPTAVHHEDLHTAQVMMLGHVKPGLDEAGFNYVMSTTLVAPADGTHTIGVRSTGSYRLLVDDIEVLSASGIVANAEDLLFTPAKLEKSVLYAMKAGQSYTIKLLVHDQKSPKQKPNEPGAYASALCFQQEHPIEKVIETAVASAKRSDVAIVFAGRNAEHETEGGDMVDIQIPGDQLRLIQEVSAVSKKSIVVLYGGGAMDVSSFVDAVDAIIFAHYPGQEGGTAIANVLCGKTNPSGKLTTTWPRRLEDTPTWKHFPAIPKPDDGVNMELAEGLEVGYRRNWENIPGGPRYMFGHGLSYTSFSYTNLCLEPSAINLADEGTTDISVKLTLTNNGPVEGAEVVQLYVAPASDGNKSDPSVSMHHAKTLKGFQKLRLGSGESTEVRITVSLESAISFWHTETSEWRTAPGIYNFSIGSGPDAPYKSLTVTDKQ